MKQFLSHTTLVLAFCLMAFHAKEAVAQTPQGIEGRSALPPVAEKLPPSAEKLLRSASVSLLRSPSFQCKVLLHNLMFDQAMTAEGYYLNKGQGSGKSKFHFAFGDQAERPMQMTQVCDGRMNYCLKQGGAKPSLEFVDLLQISKADHRGRVANPTAWMTTGGISSLLEHSAKSLEFQPAKQYSNSGFTAWHLRGTWKKDALKKFFGNSVNHKWIDDPDQWHKLPGQLPHVLEFHLSTDPGLPLVPFQIDFLQLQKNDDKTEIKKVLSIQLKDFETVADMSDELFKINNEDVAPVDVTDMFVGRVEQNYGNGLSDSGRTAGTAPQASPQSRR